MHLWFQLRLLSYADRYEKQSLEIKKTVHTRKPSTLSMLFFLLSAFICIFSIVHDQSFFDRGPRCESEMMSLRDAR